MTAFQSQLDKYRKISHSERDKGDRFERLMQAYLQSDPKYAYLFKNVWLWKSSITDDPNDWAKEVGNPRYILDLLLSIINVSLQTVEIVEGLPKLKFE